MLGQSAPRRLLWRLLLWGPVLAFLALLATCASQRPRADRAFTPYLAETAQVREIADGFAIAPINDWRFDASGPIAKDRVSGEYRAQDLQRVWFALEPQPGSEAAAHTFLIFEFTGDRLLGLTVEARRETHEKYSPIAGAFNAYELSYVWASARDLLAGRVLHLRHEVFVYPVAITPEQRGALLSNVLARTRELAQAPRFYNTLFSNCTNELAKAAGLSWTYQFILTGYSDEYLFGQRLIPGESFAAAKAAADVGPLVESLSGAQSAAAFDAAFLAEMRGRWPNP